MSGRLRIVLFSHFADGFALAYSACEAAGHEPVAYVYACASRPGRGSDPGAPAAVARMVEALPPGLDLLLPRSAASLARALPGYRPDLLLCDGFPWRIPRRVLDAARLGGINVHPSLLPRHRGLIPIHWAIRAGDRETGVTVSEALAMLDTGPTVPVPERPTAVTPPAGAPGRARGDDHARRPFLRRTCPIPPQRPSGRPG